MMKLLRALTRRVLRLYAKLIRKHSGFRARGKMPNRIAYFIGGGIGDGVLAYPAITLVRKCFSHVPIDIFVPPAKYPVLRRVYAGFTVRPITARSVLSRLFSEHYDIGVANTIATFSARIELISFFLCDKSYGFHYPSEDRRTRAFDSTRPLVETIHDADQNLQLVSDSLCLRYQDEDREMPTHERSSASDDVVIIHPGVEKGYVRKMWPVDNYVALAKRLVDRGMKPRILLGPSETSLASAFRDIEGVELLESPQPADLVDAIRTAGMFVGNDSGPAHLAAFYDVPGITLIGPVDPARTAPRSNHSIYIYNHVPCAPCHFKAVDCDDNKCMKSITVDQVWEKVEELWNVD